MALKAAFTGQTTVKRLEEEELSAGNAWADALPERDASVWEEALDGGVTDCITLCACEQQMATSPDFACLCRHIDSRVQMPLLVNH